MNIRYLSWIAFVFFLSLPVSGAEVQRIAFVVGNNQGLQDEVVLKHAETDAQKIAKTLADLGGFASENIHIFLGKTADVLRRDLDQLLSPTTKRSVVFFYYSGHANRTDLHMRQSRMPISEIQSFLSKISDRITIALVDSCNSGVFTRTKGATLGPSYDIQWLENPAIEGHVVITSSREDEVSQESDRLQGSFFTHYFVSGLYGAADANRDNLVTLDEAYRFAHYRTIERTIDSSAGVQHPSYRYNVSGQGNIVLTDLGKSTAQMVITQSPAGQYFILDAKNQLILTEITKSSAADTTFRVPPGAYQVRKRESNRVLSANISLNSGQTLLLKDADMKPVEYVSEVSKSENESETTSQPHAIDPPPNEIDVNIDDAIHIHLNHIEHGPDFFFGGRTPLIDNMSVALEFVGGYRIDWKFLSIEPRGIVRIADRDASGEVYRHNEFELGMNTALRVKLGNIGLRFGIDGGIIYFNEDYDPLITRGQDLIGKSFPLGGQMGALVESSFSIIDQLELRTRFIGGGAIFELEKSPPIVLQGDTSIYVDTSPTITLRPFASGHIGLAYVFR